MVKRQLQRKAARAVDKASSSASLSSSIGKGPAMHRGRKKRVEARERLEKKRTFVDEELAKLHLLSQQRREQQRHQRLSHTVGKALAVLPDMALALPSLDDKKDDDEGDGGGGRGGRGLRGLPHREWGKTVKAERERLGRVQAHEAFVGMGVEALRAHLSHTVGGGGSVGRVGTTVGTKRRVTEGGGGKRKRGKGKGGATAAHGTGEGGDGEEEESAAERVAGRRERKKRMGERAAQLRAKGRGEVKTQTFKSLLGGGERRGRIGQTHEKI